jgi:hypothetical protein
VASLAAKTTTSNDARWYSVLGSTPMRRVFEKALGLPTTFSALDIDRQLEIMKEKSQAQLGTDQIADFDDAATMEKLVRRFLIRSEAEAYSSQYGASAALTLMSNAVTFSRRR